MNNIHICEELNSNETVLFAADELNKYMTLMMDKTEAAPGIQWRLGSLNAFHIPSLTQRATMAEEEVYAKAEKEVYAKMEDEVYAKVEDGQGVIAGLNPRSILLAVYRVLTAAGCRWIRPGVEGEIIPKVEVSQLCIQFHEKPSYRHRGICIEGAVSLENVLEMIDWLPKLGLNSYFIQFREGYTFFERWYHHTDNDKLPKTEFSVEKAREFTRIAEREIKKRGLIYHGVGHGWTCEAFGIPGISWEAVDANYPPETEKYFAMQDGKRRMSDHIPLNLNLCYSNPEVHRKMIQSVIDYLEVHQNVEVLHFWIGDGRNNQCECEECRKQIPTDYYVQILNELDRSLTEHGIETKIVFLLYYDLLWAPLQNRILNPDRFILMFAPISRTYSASFGQTKVTDPCLPYVRNSLNMPETIPENLSLLRAWQRQFQGDSFDFDYYLMWDHFYDPGNISTAKTIYQDVQNLKTIGLQGLISCQCQRAFYPTGLAVTVMAKTLWNAGADFEQMTLEYFMDAFGADGNLCRSFMSSFSELFTPQYLRGEIMQPTEEIRKGYRELEGVCEAYEELLQGHRPPMYESQKKSWDYLRYHKTITLMMARMMAYRCSRDMEGVHNVWENLKEYIRVHEAQLQPIFDLYEFIQTFEVMNGYTLKGAV